TFKPFDATFKHLVEAHPLDALAFVGITQVQNVEVVDTDLSTVVSAADKLLQVTTGKGKFLAHLEFQTGPDAELLDRLFWYNAVSYRRRRLPVLSVLMLLTRQADSPRFTGTMEIRVPGGSLTQVFYYQVVRVWEKPLEEFLRGGLGVIPLAPLSD